MQQLSHSRLTHSRAAVCPSAGSSRKPSAAQPVIINRRAPLAGVVCAARRSRRGGTEDDEDTDENQTVVKPAGESDVVSSSSVVSVSRGSSSSSKKEQSPEQKVCVRANKEKDSLTSTTAAHHFFHAPVGRSIADVYVCFVRFPPPLMPMPPQKNLYVCLGQAQDAEGDAVQDQQQAWSGHCHDDGSRGAGRVSSTAQGGGGSGAVAWFQQSCMRRQPHLPIHTHGLQFHSCTPAALHPPPPPHHTCCQHSERFSSGCLTLDRALGGGYPKGRIVEIFGPEASGKTTLALHAIAEVQKAGGVACFIDAEHAFDPSYAAVSCVLRQWTHMQAHGVGWFEFRSTCVLSGWMLSAEKRKRCCSHQSQRHSVA